MIVTPVRLAFGIVHCASLNRLRHPLPDDVRRIPLSSADGIDLTALIFLLRDDDELKIEIPVSPRAVGGPFDGSRRGRRSRLFTTSAGEAIDAPGKPNRVVPFQRDRETSLPARTEEATRVRSPAGEDLARRRVSNESDPAHRDDRRPGDIGVSMPSRKRCTTSDGHFITRLHRV